MTPSPIKVLLVEDSPIALEILQRMLKSSEEILVVGTAGNGREALALIPKVKPDIICTDFHMSKMDGLELTRQVMATYPVPILVVSNSVHQEDSNRIFQLLQAGAIDVFPKPVTGLLSDYEKAKAKLIGKIKVIAGVRVFTKPLAKTAAVAPIKSPHSSSLASATTIDFANASSLRIVAIGSSTGGPQALNKIFSQLPKDFPLPIICTQHISQGFLQGLVDWLDSSSQLTIKIAREAEVPIPGTVYFAPDGVHLVFNSLGKLTYLDSGTIDGHCPSVTAMMQATAKYYGKSALGILLTGMGKDGAAGMQAIARSGGITIAQDEASSVVFGMPKEAIALGAAQHVLDVGEIAPLLQKICSKKARSL